MASRSHCDTAVMMLSTSRPAAVPVSRDSATLTKDTPVQLRNDDDIHGAGIHQGQETRHARTAQGLCRFACVNDDFRQFRALHHRHSADLLRLRFERHAEVRLLLRAPPDVSNCHHILIISNTPY